MHDYQRGGVDFLKYRSHPGILEKQEYQREREYVNKGGNVSLITKLLGNYKTQSTSAYNDSAKPRSANFDAAYAV